MNKFDLKNIDKKKLIRYLITFFLFLLFFLILFKIYFRFNMTVTFDSMWYYSYIDILEGIKNFSTWNITRGFSFPFILFLIKNIIGSSPLSFSIAYFIFNVIMLYFAYKIIKNILPNKTKVIYKIILLILFLSLLVYNPLIIGYSHILLTEGIAPMFIMISCFIAIKWIDTNYKNESVKYIIYSIIFSVICVFVWFLKQPYFMITWTPFLIASILSIIKKCNLVNIISKISTLLISIILVFISINIWNNFLENKGVNFKNNSDTNFFVSNNLVSALNYHYKKNDKKQCNINYIKENKKISEKDKEKIENLYKKYDNDFCEYFIIYNIYDMNGEDKIGTSIYYKDNKKLSTKESILFVLKSFFNHPILVADSYTTNYLATIDIYYSEPKQNYNAVKKIGNNFGENGAMGLAIYNDWDTFWWTGYSENEIKKYKVTIDQMRQFEQKNYTSTKVNMWKKTFPFYQNLFKYGFLLAPFLFIIYSILFIIKRKSENKNLLIKYAAISILFGSAFINVLFHAALNANIDRYAYVGYPIMILGIICIFIPIKNKKQEKPR